MASILAVLLPIFSLILIGFLCRRHQRLGPTAASELNKFVIWLCLPALLFKTTATSSWETFWQPDFLIAFAGGCLLIFGLTLLYGLYQGRDLATASVDALSAAYANTGYMGIPLCLSILGTEGLAPALIASLVVVCVLFSIAVMGIELGLQKGQSASKMLLGITQALAKNPLVVSPLVGIAWSAAGFGLVPSVLHFLELLSAATAPCALVSLGLFLAQKQERNASGAWPLVLIKLIAQPLITGYLAYRVLALPPVWAHAALLLSALPTGTGPFMLADYYGREAATVSRVILISTLGSLLTLFLVIYWIQQTP